MRGEEGEFLIQHMMEHMVELMIRLMVVGRM